MRTLIAFLILAAPAAAWDFSPIPVCTISDDTGDVQTSVTYDPRRDLPYAISVTRAVPWPSSSMFGMRFDGPFALTITTDRHQRSADGRTLTVADTGFGNVLGGLAHNTMATAFTDTAAEVMPLVGATAAVRAFVSCTAAPLT